MKRTFHILVLFALVCHVYALDKQEGLLLEKIVLLNNANQKTLNSLEYVYNSDIKLIDTAGTQKDIVKQGHFAFKDEKVYSKEVLEDGIDFLFVKNGNMLTTKSAEKEDMPLVTVGTSGNPNIKPGSPSSWNMVDNGLALKLNNLPKNEWSIKSVRNIETEKENLVKVELLKHDLDPNGDEVKIPVEIYYSPKYGYAPIKIKSDFKHSSGQTLFEEASVLDFKEIDLHGTIVYLPIKVNRKLIRNGIVSFENHYSIEEKSVKINPNLPDSMFIVSIGPKDQVVNLDINMELQGPGGRDFLSEVIAFESLNDNITVEENISVTDKKYRIIELAKGINIELVEIPTGRFLMGSPESEIGYPDSIVATLKSKEKALSPENEHPQKQVDVSRFMLAKTEITVEQFKFFLPSYSKAAYEGFDQNEKTFPAMVTWNQASSFCNWLSQRTGYKVRLPNENEWEYACRANSTTRFFWGDNEKDAGRFANIADQAYEKKWPGRLNILNTNDKSPWVNSVASYEANAFGLYDMLGNVAEWCDEDYFKNNEQQDEMSNNRKKVIRGGGANSDITSCRCASRAYSLPKEKDHLVGFRIVVEF